jgi:hypothetical protein
LTSDSKKKRWQPHDQTFPLMVAEAAGNEVVVRIMTNLIDLLRQSCLPSSRETRLKRRADSADRE